MAELYGVKPPKKDLRDYKINSISITEPYAELRHLPKVKNQGSINSCAAHAASSILEWFNETETREYKEYSTDFIYGMQGIACNQLTPGMYLRDVCKIIKNYGDCLKNTIPTNTEMPQCAENLSELLTDVVYKEAAICKVKSYAKCDTDESIKYALLNYGAVLGSVKWYNKYSLKDGVIHFDTSSDNGYHAVMIYGFNEQGWLCQNSWGSKWGEKGRFILPYSHGFCEAWSFVDEENTDVYKPKNNELFNVLYKLLNLIINVIREILPSGEGRRNNA